MEGEILVHFTPKGENVNSQISICLVQWKKLLEEEEEEEEEAIRGRWRFSSNEEVICAVQNLLKKQPENFSSDGIKKLWDAGTGALKSSGITLKCNISFVYVYIYYKYTFFESKVNFLLTLLFGWY
jgi:hypothetical protein